MVVAFGDANGDGAVDLFVGNEGMYKQENELWLNTNDGSGCTRVRRLECTTGTCLMRTALTARASSLTLAAYAALLRRLTCARSLM